MARFKRSEVVDAVKRARAEVRAAWRTGDHRRVARAWHRLDAAERVAERALGRRAIAEIDRDMTWARENLR